MERMRDVIKAGLRVGLGTLSPQDRLEMAWIAVCGPRLAAQGSIVGYEEESGTVTVEVREKPWLEELRSISSRLEPELAQSAGVKISKLHFRVKR